MTFRPPEPPNLTIAEAVTLCHFRTVLTGGWPAEIVDVCALVEGDPFPLPAEDLERFASVVRGGGAVLLALVNGRGGRA